MSKTFLLHAKVFLVTVALLFQSCKKDDNIDISPNDPENRVTQNTSFGAMFLAQTHVRQLEEENFKLVSGKAALIKVNRVTGNESDAQGLTAILTLGATTETIILTAPTSDELLDLNPGATIHKFENSHTATIPKELVQPGLKLVLKAGDESITFDDLKIGAPNKMIMNMFDVSFFSATTGDYAVGWKDELSAKLPVSEIELRRLPNILFSELTVPARPDAQAIAARVSSKEEYQTITGASFDGEQGAASQWKGALKAAAGTKGRYALFYVNIYGVHAGGQAGGYGGVGNGTSLGILHHELGHALSLPHWGNNANYPYRDEMFGIAAPEVFNGVHVGPTWAFDMTKNVFIPPTVQMNAVGGEPGTYKKDPMQGGGSGDQEEGFLLRHFSDYSVTKIQNFLEDHIVVRNGTDGNYAKWNSDVGGYTDIQENNSISFAVENDVDVISVMAGVSAVTPQATIVYPPIGPYKSGVIELFDPSNEEDRAKADTSYCPDGGCDVSLRIVQGGVTKTMMLPIAMDAEADPLKSDSFKTRAVNLLASEGTVTSIELLRTPDAELNGLPNDSEVLRVWE